MKVTRDIIFDTETTGMDKNDDRLIEIGGVELIDHFPTGKTFHVYVNPDGKTVHPEALQVHGISDEFLKDKPVFADVVDDLLAFFDGARWIAHNAAFDMGFINAELGRLGKPPIDQEMVVDTLALARRKHPMGPNSLDALCKRYSIDNAHRTKHGALLDAELLAEVYIEMSGGRQAAFRLVNAGSADEYDSDGNLRKLPPLVRPRPLPSRVHAEEAEAHAKMLAEIGDKALWHSVSGT
ncbi:MULTISPECIES: DNA polymerase III subunit epsilon [Martelella]|uniref:DNA polymerase III subunit epsilon n=2 Tax=Martelella TaxID=293088 RepID=A0A5C4JX75_9HYPH|nr:MULTISPECIES: DNA polymerase III subunit epsilon [Martelella]MAM12377.1 DNA polymerase III subunit epsilon [Rhizobiaceae bacterium]AMM86334.1 DNA polymerase III subunit epsilon [Martelella sp. AD-3]MBB4121191.1 DNA polymerase-3 subunit epsilon [Martelella radicis]QQM30659.1 DNA polymerase III subunit epsilon [Martelella lutilitoris]TNB49820.1 DNA polymerase III subunit epsilon [Martelella lutilitoris]